jgi:hypothetical protein
MVFLSCPSCPEIVRVFDKEAGQKRMSPFESTSGIRCLCLPPVGEQGLGSMPESTCRPTPEN